MNTSQALFALLLGASSGVLASSPADSPNGMVIMSGPVSGGGETNPFMAAMLRLRRKHQKSHHHHHRRQRIHRQPVQLVALGQEEPHPKAFLEVMKIRERIVVDEQNRPKSAELALTNDLMQIDSSNGHVKMLRHGELHIKPKKHHLVGASSDESYKSERNFAATEFGADGKPVKMPQEGSRLDRFIRNLHLDQFWPLFFFSAICGFSFVGLTFLAAKLILGLIDDNERDNYEPVPNGENLLDSIESAQPIKITNEMIQTNEATAFIQTTQENEKEDQV